MSKELAQLDPEVLSKEPDYENIPLEELEKLAKAEPQTEIPVTPDPEPTPAEPTQVPEMDPPEVTTPEPVIEPTETTPDSLTAYKQGVQDTRDYLKQLQTQSKPKETKPEKPKLTKEQFLENLVSDDGQNFLDGYIEDRVTPYKKQLKDMEKSQARNIARGHADFSRLEPIINKLEEQYPDALPGQTELKRLEWYYLAAASLERQNTAKLEVQKKASKDKQLKQAKIEASAIPRSKPTISTTPRDKNPETMSMKELEKMVKGLK